MGSITDWKIRTFQKETGIQPATGAEAELLESRTKKQDQLFGSPTFVATFADGETVRMTTFCTPANLDLERGKKLAGFAYESRTKKTPPAFTSAHFEQAGTGTVIETYSAIDLEDFK